MHSNNIKPVIRSQARQIRPSLFCIFHSFDIFSLNKRLTTPLSVGSIHFKQSSVSWAEQALRKVTPTARHQESVLLYIFMYFFYWKIREKLKVLFCDGYA
jgi:hypothetical protein